MNPQTAGDLMVPLDEYPVVDASATVREAVLKLDASRRKMESGRQPFQAVLVADESGRIIGKMGQLTLLKALEPSRQIFLNRDTLDKAGVGDSIIETALDHMRAFQHEFSEICKVAAAMQVRTVMRPIGEYIHVSAPIGEVIHRMVSWQTLSVLVSDDERPVGLVRLSDLCDAAVEEISRLSNNLDSEG